MIDAEAEKEDREYKLRVEADEANQIVTNMKEQTEQIKKDAIEAREKLHEAVNDAKTAE